MTTKWITMSEPVRLDIASYLHKKYRERVRATPDDAPVYSMRQFADDIGVDYNALNAIYNNRKGAEKMSFEILRQLIYAFGRDFTDAFSLTPPDLGREK